MASSESTNYLAAIVFVVLLALMIYGVFGETILRLTQHNAKSISSSSRISGVR